MKYEISNLVSNHKYTEWEIQHHNPFGNIGRGKKKQRRYCYIIDDQPINLFKAYQRGLSMKPHAFNMEQNPETTQCFVNAIILDFDDLTEQECEFVKAVVNGKYNLMPEGKHIYGDYSSGMKTWMAENMGIPDAKPPKWKYKVFFPTLTNTLCVFEDIDKAYMDAVAFFNPTFTMEQVKEVWTAWKKANNRKDKITDPMFDKWILPDVAMLNNFRNQITYGVDPTQSDKFKELDDNTICLHLPVGMAKYPVTNKFNYIGLDWKLLDAKPHIKTREATKEQVEELKKHIKDNCQFPLDDFNLPTTKAGMALFLGKTHLDDLVMPTDDIAYINAAYWSQIKDRKFDNDFQMEKFKKDAWSVGKTFARLYAEIRWHGETKSYKVQALEDCCTAMRRFHGPNLFAIMTPKQLDELATQIATAFMSAWNNYTTWRMRQKLKDTTINPKVIELRNKWRDTKDTEDRNNYFKELNNDIKARWDEAKKIQFPYDYHRRGFKQEVMDILLNGHIKLENKEQFKERLRSHDITIEKDGEYSDEILDTWFYQYRAEWNKQNPEDPIGRKQHKSKYAEIFKDMDIEEIEDYINHLDIKPSMKTKLRGKYAKKRKYVK